MFKSKKTIDPNSTDTLIGEGSLFEGNIQSAAGIRVEGKVNGNIECEGDVTIGQKGAVKSNIFARNITIAGVVTGDVSAKDKIQITSSGKLYGNVQSAVLIIEEGAVFHGSSKMESVQTASGKADNLSGSSKEKAQTA